MELEQEIEEVEEEFKQELKKTPGLIGSEVIDSKQISSVYLNFLMEKYGDKWIEKSHSIFFKNNFFVERMMADFGYNRVETFGEESYVKKPQFCFSR